MATTTCRNIRPAVWTTWAPSAGILGLVGAHILAAALGLYSSAPNVKVLAPLTGMSRPGQLDIAVQADDGPNGSGVRRVEYQLDSTSGTWLPLTQREGTLLYTARHDTSSLASGSHALYLRAADYTGNLRTLSVPVTVTPAPAEHAEPSEPSEPATVSGGVSPHRAGEELARQDGTPRR
jgi:hypothetical protein